MANRVGMGVRRFGHVNWRGLATLARREVQRFLAVYAQTVLGPVATAVLFMTVFTLAFGERRGEMQGLPFEVFLAPGILMMTVIQNAFANTSSSLMIAKVQGNIVDTLMPPLSAGEMLAGYVAGGMARGLVCAAAVAVVVFPVVGVGVAHPLTALAFVLVASLLLSLIGLIAAIFAEKFDQMAAITNFVITPLSFLSGTFYSIDRLPATFQGISHANPFFYLIDGFRAGVLGVSDSPAALGLAVTGAVSAVLWWVAWRLLASGYKLKS
jgi:ABC-2 type transport system permease protein